MDARPRRTLGRRIERPLRLFTGLTLFTFVITHFLADAAGLLRIPGVGRVKCEQYGPAVLEILASERSSEAEDQAAKPGR